MDTDGFAHTGDVILENGEPKEHTMSVDCWCQPIRYRFNALTQLWEAWDRDGQVWEEMSPQPGGAPLDHTPANEEIIPTIPDDRQIGTQKYYDIDGEEADRQAGRADDIAQRYGRSV